MTERNDYRERRPLDAGDTGDRTADETIDTTTYDETTADTDRSLSGSGSRNAIRREELGTAPAGTPNQPRSWDREEWEGQNQGRKADPDARATLDDAVTGAPHWNEGEFVGEGQGGPDEGPTRDVVPEEGDSEFGGHGHNPGGGERWADVDRS